MATEKKEKLDGEHLVAALAKCGLLMKDQLQRRSSLPIWLVYAAGYTLDMLRFNVSVERGYATRSDRSW